MAKNQFLPLRNIPIRTTVDQVEITGVILTLWPNDIEVLITSPVGGLRTGLHVPHFAMYPCNWLATFSGGRTTAITVRGRSKAEELLRELYAHSQGQGSGWPVHSAGEDREKKE